MILFCYTTRQNLEQASYIAKIRIHTIIWQCNTITWKGNEGMMNYLLDVVAENNKRMQKYNKYSKSPRDDKT
jgi:hypothetical protein